MKRLLVLLLAFALIAFSGCTQENPEEKAIALADNAPEMKVLSKVFASFDNIEKCTVDEMYAILAEEGLPLPEITEEERADFREMVKEMAKCKPSLSSSAEKESENVYLISYNLKAVGECDFPEFSEEAFKVRVDLASGKAEAVEGATSAEEIAQAEEIIDKLGNCTGIVFFGAAMGMGSYT